MKRNELEYKQKYESYIAQWKTSTLLSHSYEIHDQAKLYTIFNIYVYMTCICQNYIILIKEMCCPHKSAVVTLCGEEIKCWLRKHVGVLSGNSWYYISQLRDFPSRPLQGLRFNPWLGNWHPTCHMAKQKDQIHFLT